MGVSWGCSEARAMRSRPTPPGVVGTPFYISQQFDHTFYPSNM
ncbi:hypothetical protein LI99_13635 [Mycolicibacterium smegmatis]|uniref:Uncharacterized protein n=1 Tax=Mycolicibacterium smegmatis (strain ATCC 700084 / mc(2)155) TaxID=246196 RepID=A0QVY6_MYCS2|nr:hypothetical protein MSMEG_2741 [Mycolicibacterium smegmatis MC2 155]AIU14534.1 hypothetical protein LI99_13635 [Mycolicibacterium smegmatis]AIU07909.1 hypothetical protein LJ00_13630 [Mycolicibacterium smegmatis MC2 155]AIU21157.1 hypothetical protein LI98_13640 [Mycolicibacterium smegmatis]TBH30504.1 hypothetical protein EYS45_26265 [Mycolicibacterium smegmatis MC2 155]